MPINPKLTSAEVPQIPYQEITLTQSEVKDPNTILSIKLKLLQQETSTIRQYQIHLLDGAGNTTQFNIDSNWFSKEDQKADLVEALVNSSKIRPLDYSLIRPLIFGKEQVMRLKEIIDAGCIITINPNCLNDQSLSDREREQLTLVYNTINPQVQF